LVVGQIWKAGHAAFAVFDGGGDLLGSQAAPYGYEGRHGGRRAGHFFAVADAALAHVDGARAVFAGVRGESAGPCHFI
jgi:hypothetical protein